MPDYRGGFVRDSDNALALTTDATGAEMKGGFLRAPTGELVATTDTTGAEMKGGFLRSPSRALVVEGGTGTMKGGFLRTASRALAVLQGVAGVRRGGFLRGSGGELVVGGLSAGFRQALLADGPSVLYTLDGTGAFADLQGTAPDLVPEAYGTGVLTRGEPGLASDTAESINISGTATTDGVGISALTDALLWTAGDFTFNILARPSDLPAAGTWRWLAMAGGEIGENYWFAIRNEGGTLFLETKMAGLTFTGVGGAQVQSSERLQVPYTPVVGELRMFTWRFQAGRCDVFVDGVKQGPHGTYAGTATMGAGDRFTLASYNSGGGGTFTQGWHGALDEAAFFFSAPSDARIAAWAEGAFGLREPPPAELFVSAAGSDSNDGLTAATPVATVDRAQILAGPGTVVNVADGTYAPTLLTKAGEAGAPIRYVSTNKWGATFAAPGATENDGTPLQVAAEYIEVEDFEVTGGRVALAVTAGNTAVRGCHVHGVCQQDTTTGGAGGAGIDVFNDTNAPMPPVEITGNVVNDIGLTIAGSQEVQGIYLACPSDGGLVANNVVYGVTDFGIHCFHNPRYWKIVNNTISLCGRGILACPDALVANNIVDRIGADGATGDGYDVATNTDGGVAPTVHTNLMNSAAGADAGFTVADPLFTATPALKADAFSTAFFRLADTSPARDAGTAGDAPATDFEGATRPIGTGVDIGAYEEAVVTALTYDQTIDADSPLAHWKLGEADSTGGLVARVGPAGSYINAAGGVTFGVPGLAVNNDGDTAITFVRSSAGRAEVAQAAAQAALDVSGEFTYECWISPTTDVAQSSNQNLLSRANYGLYLTPDNRPAIFYGAAFSATEATSALLAGTPYHLAYTFDGTTHTVYVNGSSVISVADVRVAGGKLGIGCYPDQSTDTANVTMDEVAIYGAALPPARVLAHHDAGFPPEPPPLAAGAVPFSNDEMFLETSFWRKPLAPDAPLHPDSARWARNVCQQFDVDPDTGAPYVDALPGNAWFSTDQGGSPLYVVGPEVPTQKVYLPPTGNAADPIIQAGWNAVPLPDGFVVGNSADRSVCIWRPSTDEMWEFWNFWPVDGPDYAYEAFWGGYMANASQSVGTYQWIDDPPGSFNWVQTGGEGHTATSMPLNAGAIQPEEIDRGFIGHALQLTTGDAAPSWEYLSPAQRSDGSGMWWHRTPEYLAANPGAAEWGSWRSGATQESYADMVPEGARLRFPADLDTSGMTGLTKMLAEAIRDYGMIITDKTGGGCSIRFRESSTYLAAGAPSPWWEGYPTTSRIKDNPNTILWGLPLHLLQVVDPSVSL